MINRLANFKWLIVGVIVLAVLILIVCLVIYLNKGRLEITSEPGGAQITVNKISVKAPTTLRLAAGKYKVIAQLEGFSPQDKEVQIVARQKITLNFSFEQTGEGFGSRYSLSADDPIFITKDHFAVEPPSASGANQYDMTVTVFATFNAGVNGPPIAEQEATYQAELKQYTREAYDWLKENNIDLNIYRIKWVPEEAQNLIPQE